MNIRKQKIQEALGVPENIEIVSKKITDHLYSQVKDQGDTEIDPNKNYDYVVKGPMNISDFKIDKVIITLALFVTNEVNDITFYGMSYGYDSSLDPNTYNIITKKSNVIPLTVRMVLPKETGNKFSDLYRFLVENRLEIQSSFSHELQHGYEGAKKPSESSKERAKYEGYTKTNFRLPPINLFLHNLYYTTAVENVVRPSEVHSIMKTAGVEKDKFVDFITSQEVYKKFKSISNLTFDDLIEDMRNHIPRINEILNEVGEGGLYNNDEDKIKRVLELLYINLGNHIIKGYHELLTENFMENLFGFSGDKKELFENFIKTVTKYKSDPIKFYEYEIDRMRKISTKMIKKISKVFGLIDDKNKSIKDWDLHTKINKRTQIESEFKY